MRVCLSGARDPSTLGWSISAGLAVIGVGAASSHDVWEVLGNLHKHQKEQKPESVHAAGQFDGVQVKAGHRSFSLGGL